MPDLDTLRALKRRVDEASGPNFDLERLVYTSLVHSGWTRLPAITASIDAALALVERCLPGWQITISIFESSSAVDLTHPDRDAPSGFSHIPSRSAALSILSALLAALIAEEEAKVDTAAK